MQVICAPQEISLDNNKEKYIFVFLAGGISNCSNWQKEVTAFLIQNLPINIKKAIIIFNPKRETVFDFTKEDESKKQIQWEFKYLEQMDLFTMFFDGPTISSQPICFYELGRHLSQMQSRFKDDFNKRIIVSYKKEFSRAFDVAIQTSLATEDKVKAIEVASPKEHAERILQSIIELTK